MSAHRSEVEVLRRRSLGFLDGARAALERGSYDIACFLAEQSLQLYLKSILLEVVGDYPRTYSVRRLLGELRDVLGSKVLRDFIKANRARLSNLEDAYLMARYFVKKYVKEDAEDMVKLVEEVMRVVGEEVGGAGKA
ncbi:MAG: DNA-binding protein [Desulfurococcales archaeon ex4484_204]|nr:MAG: DNA-binding protein [Desulfurococcales archaeon ex4484_204]